MADISPGGVTLNEYPGRRFQFSSVGTSAADMSAAILGENNRMTRSLHPAAHKNLRAPAPTTRRHLYSFAQPTIPSPSLKLDSRPLPVHLWKGARYLSTVRFGNYADFGFGSWLGFSQESPQLSTVASES